MNMRKYIPKMTLCILSIMLLFSSSLISATTISFDRPYEIMQKEYVNKGNAPNPCNFIKGSGWPLIYDHDIEDGATNIVIDSKGNIIMTGNTYNDTTKDINFLTVKYQRNGEYLWNTVFDGGKYDYAWDLAVDSQDNVIVFGFNSSLTSNPNELNITLFIIKYNSDGIELWNKTYEWEKDCFPGGIAVDSNDHIIMTAGLGDLNLMSFFCYTMKMDENGNELWNTSLTEDMISFGAAVVVNENDEIFVGGLSASFYGQGWFMVKYDNTGGLLWLQRYNQGNQPDDMEIDSQGNLIISGQDYSIERNSSSLLTLKCDPNGNILWKFEYDGIYHEYARDSTIDSNDHVIILGSIVGDDFYEPCLFMLDAQGDEQCMKKPTLDGSLFGLTVDNNDTIMVCGIVNNSVDAYNADFYCYTLSDIIPPPYEVEKPQSGYLYLGDTQLLPLLKNTIILGSITIRVHDVGSAEIEKVLFYIDDILRESTASAPYEWVWDEKVFGRHTIEIHVYDENNNIKREIIEVFKIF